MNKTIQIQLSCHQTRRSVLRAAVALQQTDLAVTQRVAVNLFFILFFYIE
jgi:hypothetical protein